MKRMLAAFGKSVVALLATLSGAATLGAATISQDTTWGLADIEAIAEPISVDAGVTLTFNLAQGEVGTVSQVIGGEGKVAMTGGGGLILTAANTFAGGFTMKGVSVPNTSGGTGVGAAYVSARNVSAFGKGTITLDGFMGEVRFSAVGDYANAIDFKQVGQLRCFDPNETSATGTINVNGAITGCCDLIVSGGQVYTQEIHLNGTITNPGHDVILRLTAAYVYFNATTVARALRGSGNASPDYYSYHQIGWSSGAALLCASNDVEIVSATGTAFYLRESKAFPATAIVSDNFCRRDSGYRGGGQIIFQADATIGYMPVMHPDAFMPVNPTGGPGQWAPSIASRTITVVGGSNYVSHVQLLDSGSNVLSYNWNPPTDDARIVLTNRAHTMSGTFTVSRGEVDVSGPGASLKAAKRLVVKPGATFALSTAVADPLTALERLDVSATNHVRLPAGTVLSLKSLLVDGVPQFEPCASATTPWLEGENVRIEVADTCTLGKAECEALTAPVTVPAGKTLAIDTASGEGVVFAQRIDGEGSVRLTGSGDVTFTAANAYSGGLTVDSHATANTNRVTVTDASGFGTGPVTVNQKTWIVLAAPGAAVTYANDFVFNDRGYLYPKASVSRATITLAGDISATTDFFLSAGYNSKADATGVTFEVQGTISAPGCHVIATGGSQSQTWNFRGSITAFAVRSACGFFTPGCSDCDLYNGGAGYSHGWGGGNYHFYAANDIELLGPAGAAYFLHDAAAVTAKTTIRDNAYRNDPNHSSCDVRLEGLDLTVGRIDVDLGGNFVIVDGSTGTYGPGLLKGSVAIVGGGSYVSSAKFIDKMSVTWNPPDDESTLCLTNRSHTMSGTLTVARGAVHAQGASVSFKSLAKLVVAPGATFLFSSSVANAFAALREIELGAGAVLALEKGATPFTAGLVSLSLGAGATVNLGDGVVAAFANVSRDGAYLEEKTYSAGEEGSDWITGAGSATVSSAGSTRVPWKRAADGAWDVGANWLQGAVPTTGQLAALTVPDAASYAVSVSGSAKVGGVKVENVGPGAAQLTVGSSLELTSATRFESEVCAGGKVVVTEGGELEFGPSDADAWSATARMTVRDGGELAIDGGTLTMTNHAGSLVIGAGGTLSATAGELHVHPKGIAGGGVVVEKGGAVSLSGEACMVFSPAAWQGTALSVANGGVFSVSGSAALRPDARGTAITVELDGTMSFSDNSVFGSASSPEGIEGGWGYYVRPTASAGDAKLVFTDHAALRDTSYSFKLGSPAGATARLELRSDATHRMNSSCYVGTGDGRGELLIADGKLEANSQGIHLPGAYEQQGAKQALNCSGELEMTGGKLTIAGSDDDNRSFRGLVIGDASVTLTNAQGQAFGDRMVGVLKMSGDASVSLDSKASLILGVGSPNASGTIEQTGGTVENKVTDQVSPTVIGMGGATGEWLMTGGAASIAGDLYVGGVTLQEIKRTIPLTSADSGNNSARLYCGDRYTGEARGRLEVGGQFAVGGDLILSADGTGTLVLTPKGRLTVGGKLDARAGSKLVLDFTGYTGRGRRLATFAGGTTAAFDEANVEVRNLPDGYGVRVTATGVSFTDNKGAMLIVR